MQVITDSFDTHSQQQVRNPSFQIFIDWALNGILSDESDHIIDIEGERVINEPLYSIHQAQMDITLSNIDNRYTPESDSPIANYIRISRRIQMLTGFRAENIPFARGISEDPVIDELKKTVAIHFWDELQNLANTTLSDGEDLFQNIRTDLYIWAVLDAVYANYFTVIASFDSDETITGGSAETINMRGGDQAIKLQATSGSTVSAYRALSPALDLSSYADDDLITLFVFVEDITKVSSLTLRFHKVVNNTFGDVALTNYDLQTGWNQLQVPKGDVIGDDITHPSSTWFKIGTSQIQGSDVIPSGMFDWSSVVRAEIILTAKASQTVYVIADELRMVDHVNYPERNFDMGLQTIAVAWFGGNSALSEIQHACESEGARFYSDEVGVLHLENRQHYNNTPALKVSVHQFTFDRLTDFAHPKPDQGIINDITVKINPRIIQPTAQIWQNGATPLITNGDTLEIWANFQDPVPTTSTGLITPVATTDYTANTAQDGSGTDETGNISIAITKFASAAKLEITNSSGVDVYLTMLQLRGTPAQQLGEVDVKVQDADSVAEHGVYHQDIDTPYLADQGFATDLANQIIEWYSQPINRLSIDHPFLPQLQIGDMVSALDGETGHEEIMRTTGLSFSMGVGKLFTGTSQLRIINPFETLTFFEIGTSEIGSTDVIAN